MLVIIVPVELEGAQKALLIFVFKVYRKQRQNHIKILIT